MPLNSLMTSFVAFLVCFFPGTTASFIIKCENEQSAKRSCFSLGE